MIHAEKHKADGSCWSRRLRPLLKRQLVTKQNHVKCTQCAQMAFYENLFFNPVKYIGRFLIEKRKIKYQLGAQRAGGQNIGL